ncbi:hypothetical protein [Nostoc sp. DedQUE09]|uniref:hypothetical protein n=1 Tax=Nostoc sp. DedQUE09 TaxID=3075394 RepID=UPI002AD5525A|nr:hypothetical protein [Nostoc sp. DedQUE09]MDZ7950506.1 hypothetical protein [Nostoc sp. DedQUE09]
MSTCYLCYFSDTKICLKGDIFGILYCANCDTYPIFGLVRSFGSPKPLYLTEVDSGIMQEQLKISSNKIVEKQPNAICDAAIRFGESTIAVIALL